MSRFSITILDPNGFYGPSGEEPLNREQLHSAALQLLGDIEDANGNDCMVTVLYPADAPDLTLAKRALNGDSNDLEHEALYDLVTTIDPDFEYDDDKEDDQ